MNGMLKASSRAKPTRCKRGQWSNIYDFARAEFKRVKGDYTCSCRHNATMNLTPVADHGIFADDTALDLVNVIGS